MCFNQKTYNGSMDKKIRLLHMLSIRDSLEIERPTQIQSKEMEKDISQE